MKRGEIWWAELDVPAGSEPGYRRPVLIISSNAYNTSVLATVVTAALTSNLSREDYPGNVRLPARLTGLSKASVVVVTLISTTNRRSLVECVGRLPGDLMQRIDAGLRLSLGL